MSSSNHRARRPAIQFTDDRHHLRVEVAAQGCDIPDDERARFQTLIAPLAAAVADFPASELRLAVTFHPRSRTYHAEARLRLPGRTLLAGDVGEYLDSAITRGVEKLLRRVEAYKQHPDTGAVEAAERRTAMDRDAILPEGADTGPLAEAVAGGDYRGFRVGLAGYEDWLRKRIGRWVQRYPEAESKVGDGLLLGDLVEEVYLNAFERFGHRPAKVPLGDWLEGLIDPSLKELLRHPDAERENASLARTLRDAPM